MPLANTSSYHEQKTPSNVGIHPVSSRGNVSLTQADINSELDELDREEFYRLKKVAGKKQRDIAEEEAELKARKAAAGDTADKENTGPDDAPADILGDEEDNDVIF